MKSKAKADPFIHVEEPYRPNARWVACEACWKTRKANEPWRLPCTPRRAIGVHCP